MTAKVRAFELECCYNFVSERGKPYYYYYSISSISVDMITLQVFGSSSLAQSNNLLKANTLHIITIPLFLKRT